jgi:hypothetical protein
VFFLITTQIKATKPISNPTILNSIRPWSCGLLTPIVIQILVSAFFVIHRFCVTSQKELLVFNGKSGCDYWWRCYLNWNVSHQKLVNYKRFPTNSSDNEPTNCVTGTLSHVVIHEPLWTLFAADITINLRQELIFNSFRTDDHGANVKSSAMIVRLVVNLKHYEKREENRHR